MFGAVIDEYIKDFYIINWCFPELVIVDWSVITKSVRPDFSIRHIFLILK